MAATQVMRAIPSRIQNMTGLNALVVDSDASLRDTCREIAVSLGHKVRTAESGSAARRLLAALEFDLVLLEPRISGGGLDLIAQIREMRPHAEIVVITATPTVQSAIEAMRFGAFDIVTKPFDLPELRLALDRAGAHHRERGQQRQFRDQMRPQPSAYGLIGESPEMQKLTRMIGQVAGSPSPMLIVGETGTGKELIARAIHAAGPNASRRFLTVDCRALVPTLMEIELFGQLHGDGLREGILSGTKGGTVYLDEISELPLDLQAKLLRALQERQARPVGSLDALPVSVRVIASSTRDLEHLCKEGKFRRDLLFRLNVVKITVPPLRERKQDIPLLVSHFISSMAQNGGPHFQVSDRFLQALNEQEWTAGNVRELENSIERACNQAVGTVLEFSDMPTSIQNARPEPMPPRRDARNNEFGIVPLADIEKSVIIDCVTRLAGDKLLAAKLLGIGKTTLYRKLKEYSDAGDIAHF